MENQDAHNKQNPVQQLQQKPAKDEFLIVAIGASAGGIQALQEFFKNVGNDPGVAFVVILHLSPDHDSQLAAILQRETSLPVSQVTEKVKIKPNHIYVIPPNRHLLMQDDYIAVSDNILMEERRAPVDIFFRTLADEHGPRAIAVILSGTGPNGSMGLKRIKERGGACFVQNPREAEFNEMPRNAIATDMVDEVLSLKDIPAKIISYKISLGTVEITDEPEKRPEDQQQALREIFTQLRIRTGHDFSNYKRPTLLRRIERRINIRNLPDLSSYSKFLLDNPDETVALLRDLLISVTNFFRDKESFNVIEQEIIPQIFKGKKSDSQVRIWVAGCATGEEAYSLAILCAEIMTGSADNPKVQIFATDIDESSIAQAREGLFSHVDTADISPERLRRFFNKEGNGYRIRREIRELIMFASHNFLKDPPFSHLDLITCRNVMIYLNNIAQERVAETFHFSLNPGSFLFLGSSETVDGASDLYALYNRDHHIFQSRQVSQRAYPVPESVPALKFENPRMNLITQDQEARTLERISFADLHQQLLEQYAAPSIVINEEYDIVHLSERAGKYMQVAGGELSQNLLKLIKPELRLELRSVLYQALQRQSPVEARNLKVFVEDKSEIINIHVRPVLRQGDSARGFILVLFEPSTDGEGKDVMLVSDEPLARQLEEELIRLKTQLRSSNEQHEFQAEELKASNEELQAINEELRSAAEELETSKEELQSINEELRTVNQELKIKIEETSISSNNLQNLINSANIGTIFLDRSLRVAFFTPAARDIFNLIPNDYGRPLSDITNNIEYTGLLRDVETVLEKLNSVEREVYTKQQKSYLMRVTPYRTDEDRIKGVVLTFVDITKRKKAEEAERSSVERLRVTMESAIDYAIIGMDTDRRIEEWNTGAARIFGYSAEEILGKNADIIFTTEDRASGFAEQEMQLAKDQGYAEDEKWHLRKDGSKVYMSGVMRAIYNPDLSGFVKVARDMTKQKKADEQLRVFEERNRIALQSAEMGSWDWNIKEDKVAWNEQHYTLLGLTPDSEEKQAAYFLKYLHPDDKDRIEKSLKEAVDVSGMYKAEFRILKNGNKEMRWMSGFGRVIEWEKSYATRMVGVMFDITDRKKLEQQKEEFMSIASHELKTPVTSIKAYGELLLDTFEQNDDEESVSLIKKMNAQVNRMNTLIGDLLDTTKISEGQLALVCEDFNLTELIAELVGELQQLSQKHTLIITCEETNIVNADRKRIEQVITNLISNAIKYSPGGGEVRIDCETLGKEIRVCVSDPGIGIPEEFREKIFSRFFRVSHPQSNTFPGMGLGLYITAGIVHRHGGIIGVKNNQKKGSTFYFTLPIS